ncbi:MAG: hypothetical protein ACR2MM_07080 [Flavobacteriaceae bacterium]
MKLAKLISELKRRNVFKATIAYLAVAWVIIQIASIILPTFDVPDYALKLLIYLLAAGLIIWVGFSWIYDITPEGVQKTEDAPVDAETSRLNNRRLNAVIVGSVLIAVLLLVVASFWAGSQWNEGIFDSETKRVAILPFVEKVEGEAEEYIKTGLTQGLISELSKVDQLRVLNLPSSSVLASGFSTTNLLIVNEINLVDYFVTGSFERKDGQLEVLIKLKEELEARPSWQKRYLGDLSEIRKIWAEVAFDLSNQMAIEVKQEDLALWSDLRPVKPETYELYLKGKHYLVKSTEEDWQRGLVYFQEAIDQNPADPYAYAGMAEAYVSIGHGLMPPDDVFPKAEAAAKRAIQLDSLNAEGWAALSHYHTYFGWDWNLAEYAFNKANELNPNMAYNHYHRSWFLALFGRMNEAIEEHKKAQEIDPFTPLHSAWLGELYRWVGLYEEALAEAEKASQMDNDYALSMFIKGRIYLDQGKEEDALEIFSRASEINSGWRYLGYGPALIQTGHIEEGKAIIEELEKLEPSSFGSLCLAYMYTTLEDYNKAFENLEHAKKHAFYPWIRVMITDKKMRQDPRYLQLIREMNLPDPAPLNFNPEL